MLTASGDEASRAAAAAATMSAELPPTDFVRWWTRASCVLIVAALVLYLASVSTRWHPTPDSALYLMLGDNLAAGEGYTLWGEPHRHVPPGYPAMLATQKSLGLGSFLGLNLAMALMAMAALACCYFALRMQVSSAVALWVVCLLAFSHAMHLNSVRLLSDIPFMAILWLGLWMQLRGLRAGAQTLEVGTLLLLASCLVRVVGVPIVLGAALGLVLQSSEISRKRVWANAAAIVLIIVTIGGTAAAYLLWGEAAKTSHSYFTNFAAWFDHGWLTELLQPLVYAVRTGTQLSILLTGQTNVALGRWTAVLWIPILVGVVICIRRRQPFGVCLLVAYVGALLLFRPLLARYLLPVAPLLIWYFLEGVRWVADRSLDWTVRGQRVAVACGIVMLALGVPKAIKLAYETHVPEEVKVGSEQYAVAQSIELLRATAGPDDRFISNKNGRVMAYQSGVWSLPKVERELAFTEVSAAELRRWTDKGATFVMLYRRGADIKYARLSTTLQSLPQYHAVFKSDDFELYSSHAHVQWPDDPTSPRTADAAGQARPRKTANKSRH